MATFKVVQDKRYSRKDNSHRYCLRATVYGSVLYLQLKLELTDQEHKMVFEKNSMAKKCIDYREHCNGIETKAQRIYNSMKRWDPKRFKLLFYGNGDNITQPDNDLPKTLLLKELTDYYLKQVDIKRSTGIHFKCSMSRIEHFSPGLYIDDIDPRFLKRFESLELNKGKTPSTVSSYMRNLRTLINYFMTNKKIVPLDYSYPFAKGGYSIKTVKKRKRVMSEEEIQKIIDLDKFDSPKEEYARNIWLVLFYANGINPIDLLKLRWDRIKSDHIPLIRTKTESTIKNEIVEISIPLTEELRYYLKKVGDPTSPFVLGKLKEGYTQTSLLNRKNRFRNEINTELKRIGKRLNLSVTLTMAKARDSYASTNKRNFVPTEFTSDMLGHTDIRTTKAYLDSLSIDESFDVNNKLPKRKNLNDKKNDGREDQEVEIQKEQTLTFDEKS